MKNEKTFIFERTFDAKVWKTGNSFVITIPSSTVSKLKIKSGENLEVTIRKWFINWVGHYDLRQPQQPTYKKYRRYLK